MEINQCVGCMPSSRRRNGGNLASMAWKLHAIEQIQLRGRHRVDGVGRPKFDSHAGEYASLDYTLVGTREHDLLEALCAACESQDEEAVATAAAEYDRVKRLDPWTTKLLLAVKDTCVAAELPEPVVEAAAGLKLEDADELPDLT